MASSSNHEISYASATATRLDLKRAGSSETKNMKCKESKEINPVAVNGGKDFSKTDNRDSKMENGDHDAAGDLGEPSLSDDNFIVVSRKDKKKDKSKLAHLKNSKYNNKFNSKKQQKNSNKVVNGSISSKDSDSQNGSSRSSSVNSNDKHVVFIEAPMPLKSAWGPPATVIDASSNPEEKAPVAKAPVTPQKTTQIVSKDSKPSKPEIRKSKAGGMC